MSNIEIKKGNLFTSNSQTLVNTVNTVGVMGAGIALEFRFRYPDMYNKYVDLCKNKQLAIGKLWLYKSDKKWILNFPTKEDWKDDSKTLYLEKGLQKFLDSYKKKDIKSIAFPVLGARNGNIPEKVSLEIMEKYLVKCDIPIEIIIYDRNASDDIFELLKNKLTNLSIEEISIATCIQKQYCELILKSINEIKINNMSYLATIEGIGKKTLEKLYNFILFKNKDTKDINEISINIEMNKNQLQI